MGYRCRIKKILTLSIALSLFGLAFPMAATALSSVRFEPTEVIEAAITKAAKTVKFYDIIAKEIESTPPGCFSCKPQKEYVPSFSPVSDAARYDSILGASKIDTFKTTDPDSSCTGGLCNALAKTLDGACALVGGKLLCFGANQFGQLGNESADPVTITTPTPATNGGVALTGITDIASNGETTCIVQFGALKCVGKGNWSSRRTRKTTTTSSVTTRTWAEASGTYSDLSATSVGSELNETLDDDNNVLSSVIDNGYKGPKFSTTWQDLDVGGLVKSVQIGVSSNPLSKLSICALMTVGTVKCANIPVTTSGTSSNTNVTRYDCSNPVDGEYESEVYCLSIQGWVDKTFKVRNTSVNINLLPAVTWSWVTAKGTPDSAGVAAEITDAKDINLVALLSGEFQLCIAAAAVTCRLFSGAEFGVTSASIEGSEGSSRVYSSSGIGLPNLCVHKNGILSCGTGDQPKPPKYLVEMPTVLTQVGVMAEPLSMFAGDFSMPRIYFVLPSGLLSANSWIFSCKECDGDSRGVITPVSVFADSTRTAYNYTTGIAGASDSVKLIPLKVDSDRRTARAGVLLTFKTNKGELLAGSSFKWATADFPVLASSAKATNLVTDSTGSVRASIAGGPVTFTITGGNLSSGASLQSSTFTTLIPNTGNATITLTSPTDLVTRTVKVVTANGKPVPNATIKLKNNYLSYAYSSSANGTSSWATEAAGADFVLATCSQCFVAPPVYIAGDDGTVSFKSFAPKTRSSKYDALIEYDDGDLNRSIEVNFTGISDTVEMPFMPSLDVSVVDADKSTPTVEVVAGANGTVVIPVQLLDETGAPWAGFAANATEVCDAADTGGLFSATGSITNVCSSGGVSTKGVAPSSGVHAFAPCSAGRATTDADGKAVVQICATSSKKFRIAGVGALPSRTFCVKVNGVKCAEPVSAASLKFQNLVLAKTAVFPKGIFNEVYMYKVSQALSRKLSISLATLGNAAKNTMSTAKLIKSLSFSIGSSTSATPTICKVQGAYVTALNKKGICQILVTLSQNGNINTKDKRKVFIQVT